MNNVIKIDIVSDVVCPWCVIGYLRLKKAIVELNIEDKIKIQWQPFELNPNISLEGENIIEHMSSKYGMQKEAVKTYQEERKKTAEELGFTFDSYDEMNIVNTRDCHILLEYAEKFDKQIELQMRLFAAHFSERKNISDRTILKREVESLGLNVTEAMSLLDGEYKNKIEEKEEIWRKKGISSVPTMIFNNSMMMNGAYPIETYKDVLLELIEKEKEKVN
jgi:predicted DsbA family dithiol-disulfide isomerase